MAEQQYQARIAIIGGGIAGTALANGLKRLPNVDAHIFEVDSTFSERGAAIAFAKLHIEALGQLAPSVEEMLTRAGAVPLASVRCMIGSGLHAGDIVFDSGDEGDMVLHRASLLRELLAPLPAESLHTNKRLLAIGQATNETASDPVLSGGGVQLAFEDGSVENFDAVIGADGLSSHVRNYVLQDAAATCAATPVGFWDCRYVVPVERARHVMGVAHFEHSRQFIWCGDGAAILQDILEDGTMVHFVLSAVESDPPADRRRLLDREFLAATYQTWGPFAADIINLCLDQPDGLHGYSQMEHKETPTYANGRVCIMGDAAHATSPWQAAGAGLAFEDAAVLVSILGAVSSPVELDIGLKTYDAVRRGRCQRIIDSSRRVGHICCGRDPKVGLNADKMRNVLPEQWTFMTTLNIEHHMEDAVKKFKTLVNNI